MKVKPTIPGTVIRFPSDPKRRVPDEGCEMPVSGVDREHFDRLLLTKELSTVRDAPPVAAALPAVSPVAAPTEPPHDEAAPPDPTGREPLTPITTR